MLSCKNAARLMSEGLDRKMTLGDVMQLEMHLVMCSGCRRYRTQIAFLRNACRQHPGQNRKSSSNQES